MPRKAVVDAVEARLAALWTACPVIGVNTEGETPEDASDYLIVQYPVSNTERLPINQGFYQETGGIRFVLHNQRGQGIGAALTRADVLAAMFRYQKFDGVETQAPSSPLLHDANDQGNYFILTVVAPYTATFSD